ncbi:uncharacterized protein LOC122913410 [Neovison vison]|uniref:uncharacterized protein LOC122913410 n=1 Tax=Neovison vison TaxID=452646 RepID=UPI001CEFFCC5|nr:uncharacterized protein LOC122913410 [Neogale vison]
MMQTSARDADRAGTTRGGLESLASQFGRAWAGVLPSQGEAWQSLSFPTCKAGRSVPLQRSGPGALPGRGREGSASDHWGAAKAVSGGPGAEQRRSVQRERTPAGQFWGSEVQDGSSELKCPVPSGGSRREAVPRIFSRLQSRPDVSKLTLQAQRGLHRVPWLRGRGGEDPLEVRAQAQGQPRDLSWPASTPPGPKDSICWPALSLRRWSRTTARAVRPSGCGLGMLYQGAPTPRAVLRCRAGAAHLRVPLLLRRPGNTFTETHRNQV